MGRRGLTVTCIVAGLAIVGWIIVGRGAPPQMGAEKEVFGAVDALFTAVTARDAKLLADCEERLRALHAAGKMPDEAWAYVGGVVKEAREGEWRSAAETLFGFMKAQRREAA